MDRSSLIGMTAGAAFMFSFGAVWLLIGLFRGRPSPAWLRLSLLIVSLALGVSIAILGLRAYGLPQLSIPLPAQTFAPHRQLAQHFYVIVGAEVVSILLAVIALKAIHYSDHILCGIALIVGVHFFPLAALFRVPLYYGTALTGSAIGLIGFFVTDSALRQKVVGLSFGLLLWTTAALIVCIGFFHPTAS